MKYRFRSILNVQEICEKNSFEEVYIDRDTCHIRVSINELIGTRRRSVCVSLHYLYLCYYVFMYLWL